MIRTIEVPGEQVVVRADIGKGRIVKATLWIEEVTAEEGKRAIHVDDPFGRELDELLAATEVVSEFVDDSREAIYGPDPEKMSDPESH